jgi:TonB family protein
MACAKAVSGTSLRAVPLSFRVVRALVATLVTSIVPSIVVAQSILVTEHKGKPFPVVGAKGMRPYVEIDGKRVVGDGMKFGLKKVSDFLPVFVKVRGLKVSTSSLNLVNSGAQLNNEFHFRADFESPYSLKDVFLVLELTMEEGGDSLFLYEIGTLESNRPRPIGVTARTGYPLGAGRFKFHLFSGGLEILHSELPFATREAMLDRLIARRIKDRPDGPPSVLFGPTPEYPAKLGKTKTAGEVKMRVRIRATGAVLDATVESATEPAMGESALAAIRQWRFLPRIKNGHAIETVAVIPIEFTPTSEPEPES